MGLCRQNAPDCQLYAVDNDVVWSPGQASATPVYAKTVPADTTTRLDFSMGVNPDCSSRGVPKLWVVKPPAHGSVTVSQRADFPRFPATNPYSVCNRQKVPGMAVDYTPAAGFTGTDALVFEEISLDHHDLVFRMALTVR